MYPHREEHPIRKRIKAAVAVLAASITVAFVAIAGADAPGTGIIVCHDPSGQNPQTLTTPNEASYDAHIGHGDTDGPCPEGPPDDEPTVPDDEPTVPDDEPTIPDEPTVPVEPATPGEPSGASDVPEPGSTPEARDAAKQAQAAVNSGTASLDEEQGGPEQLGG